VQQVHHIQSDKNVIPDALSGIDTITLQTQLPDFTTLSKEQEKDPELQRSIIYGTLVGSLCLEARDTG